MGIIILAGLVVLGIYLFFIGDQIENRENDIKFFLERYKFNSEKMDHLYQSRDENIKRMNYYKEAVDRDGKAIKTFAENLKCWKRELERLGVKVC